MTTAEGVKPIVQKIKLKKRYWIGIPVVLLLIIGIWYGTKAPAVEYVTEVAQKSNLQQTVTATGKIESKDKADLSFQVSGQIKEVLVKSGDVVIVGQALVKLNDTTIQSDLDKAMANVDYQQSAYDKLIMGARSEDVSVSRESVTSAKLAFENAQIDLDTLKNKIAADESAQQVAITSAQISLADTKSSTDLSISQSRTNLIVALQTANTRSENSRNVVGDILDDVDLKNLYGVENLVAVNNSKHYHDTSLVDINIAQDSLRTANSSLTDSDLTQAVSASLKALDTVELMLDSTLEALNGSLTSASFTDAELAAYKTTVKTEQATNSASTVDIRLKEQYWHTAQTEKDININLSQSKLDAAQAQLKSLQTNNKYLLTQAQGRLDAAQGSLRLAQAQLNLKVSGPLKTELDAARSQLETALASMAQIEDLLSKYTLTSPFEGVVADVKFDSGETVTPAAPVVSVIGPKKFKITVNVPESDIIKISLTDNVMITLDAYGDEVKFTGNVVKIDPAQTEIQDVVYYSVEVEMQSTEMEVKQGMTANLDIITDEKNDIITLPQRAVLDRQDGAKYVRILQGNKISENEVTTGLRGDQGRIEITQGVSVGETIVVLERKP